MLVLIVLHNYSLLMWTFVALFNLEKHHVWLPVRRVDQLGLNQVMN